MTLDSMIMAVHGKTNCVTLLPHQISPSLLSLNPNCMFLLMVMSINQTVVCFMQHSERSDTTHSIFSETDLVNLAKLTGYFWRKIFPRNEPLTKKQTKTTIALGSC